VTNAFQIALITRKADEFPNGGLTDIPAGRPQGFGYDHFDSALGF
jgi:hypothetical protein